MKIPDIKNKGMKWLKSQGWTDVSEKIDYILLSNKLEEYPYKPHALIEKESQQFFVNFFNKEDYFPSKKLQVYVTGMDWWKYKFTKTLEILLKIPSAVVFHNQLTDEFIFRQLNQLPNPIRWRASLCLAKQYKRNMEQYQCYLCWQNNPQTTHNCLYRKQKGRPMAVWDIANFADSTIYQSQLFNKKYDEPTEYKESSQRTFNSNRRKSKPRRVKKNSFKSSKSIYANI